MENLKGLQSKEGTGREGKICIRFCRKTFFKIDILDNKILDVIKLLYEYE